MRGGIDAHAHRRLLVAFDRDQADAGDFAELLREHGVGEIVDLLQRQRVGGEREREDRGVGRIDLAVGRRIRQSSSAARRRRR